MMRSKVLAVVAGAAVAAASPAFGAAPGYAADGPQPGIAYGWGANNFAQTGAGTAAAQYNSPQRTVLPDDVVQVQSGGRAGYARLADGRLLAWGYNLNSVLGNGSTLASTRPAAAVLGIGGVGTLGDVVDVAVHMESAVAAVLGDGTVVAWGSNASRQLGDGSTASVRAYPERVLTAPGTPLTGAVDVESGTEATYALMADGTVTAWGAVKCDGALAGTTPFATPVAGLSDIRQIAVAGGVALFRRADGAVLSCGGEARALGRPFGPLNSTTSAYVPAQVTDLGPGSGVVDISVGTSAVSALTGDGRLYLWGDNTQYQLTPLGGPGGVAVPTELVRPAGEPKIVDVENDNSPVTYAVRADGSMLVWGCNMFGMAGIGTTTIQVSPTVVSVPGRAFVSVAAANWDVLAVTVPAV
ncbi:RCC1 domain-containing protein [Dactylosporangium sp. CA-139114]|uniref:RCC1 domain-containing protein n=1 Tax=Dactylosporangium sp. CA-139114 TaxID=3239931 RepID=UPI003D996385